MAARSLGTECRTKLLDAALSAYSHLTYVVRSAKNWSHLLNVVPVGDASFLVSLVVVEDPAHQGGALPIGNAQVTEFRELNPSHLAGVEVRILVVDCRRESQYILFLARLSGREAEYRLFDYVSFIRLPYEIKAFVSIICVISAVEIIANLLKVRFWNLFCLKDDK